MGYNTDFFGSFDIDKKLLPMHKIYLECFAGSRRVKRDSKKAEEFPDPIRRCVGLPIGDEGEFFVGSYLDEEGRINLAKNYDQIKDYSVIDYNSPSCTQPSLWCQWVPDEEGQHIICDGEKFLFYVEWLNYIIDNFLKPWRYTLNGNVEYQGEDFYDRGVIQVVDNTVSCFED